MGNSVSRHPSCWGAVLLLTTVLLSTSGCGGSPVKQSAPPMADKPPAAATARGSVSATITPPAPSATEAAPAPATAVSAPVHRRHHRHHAKKAAEQTETASASAPAPDKPQSNAAPVAASPMTPVATQPAPSAATGEASGKSHSNGWLFGGLLVAILVVLALVGFIAKAKRKP